MNLIKYLNWKYRGHAIRILGIDMGSRNSAITILDHFYNKPPELIFSEIVPVPIDNMGKTLKQQTRKFRAYFNSVLQRYKPEVIVPELFFQRQFRSNLASPISYMIGLMTEIANQYGIETKATMPSQWKRALEKQITRVDNIYDRTYPIKLRLPDHPVDALCLSIFHSPQSFKSVTQCQLLQLVSQIKDSTFIQNWLNQEKQRKLLMKKSKKKKKRRKKPLLVKS